LKWITWVGVALMFGLLALVAKTTADTNGKLDVIAAREPQKVGDMPSESVTTWKTAKGMKTVKTTRGANETAAQWAARDLEEVNAMRALYPEVP